MATIHARSFRIVSNAYFPVTFSTGNLSIGIGQAHVKYNAYLDVTKRCGPMKTFILYYEGTLVATVTDEYNFQYRPNAASLKDYLNNMGYYAQQGRGMKSFNVTVLITEEIKNDSVEASSFKP